MTADRADESVRWPESREALGPIARLLAAGFEDSDNSSCNGAATHESDLHNS